MKRKLMMLIGSMAIIFLLGACRQGNESELNNEGILIGVPNFEFPKEYLDWIIEQDFEIILNFEDVDGNSLNEEDILTENWKTVSIFPLQLSIEDATLLVTSTNDLTPIPVNFYYKFIDDNQEITEFSEKFNQLVEVNFSDFISDNGNSVDLLIWADITLSDFAFVEVSIEGEQHLIERTFFKSSIQEEDGLLIYNWLDLSGAYLRNGFIFTDNNGVQRLFVFGLDSNQENEETLIFTELEIEGKIEIPEIEQPSMAEPLPLPTATPETPISLPTTHVVQIGETLFSISQHFRVSVAQIQQANNMGTSTEISVGQQLNINNDSIVVQTPSESTPTPVQPTSPQFVVNAALKANAGTNFSRIHTFHGSIFGAIGQETDIVIWANGVLRDFQVHLGERTHRMGDIAIGEAVEIQTMMNYFAAMTSTTISFVNEGGVREFYDVTDRSGPGADQVGLIPPLG